MNSEQNDINANNCRTVNSRQSTHNSSLSTIHSYAFTLAETLIVMGIIGVVAALTIPNVNKNTGEAEKVAKFKKLYAELSEAHDRATAVYGPVEKWFVNDTDYGPLAKRYLDRITEFMKVTKTCGSNESSEVECMTSSTKNFLDGFVVDNGDHSDIGSAILVNGASFGIYIPYEDKDCSDAYLYDSAGNFRPIVCGVITLDIDGPKKGKNTYGIDLFRLAITKEGLKPAARYDVDACSSEWLSSHMDEITKCGYAAGQWIMDFGNMDYLMVKDRSTNEKARTCPNGKKLGYDTDAGDVSSCK
ncbi:type II secretion system protein [bacterium]|nr:type II secretion system protein [bacterium]